MGMVHLTERAGARGLEGEQGIVRTRVCRWEMIRVEDYLEMRAAANVIPENSHELVHGSLGWEGTSALHVRNLEARLGTSQLLGVL